MCIRDRYTDDPRSNVNAELIRVVPEITEELLSMGKDTSSSDVGTGGMSAKLTAARIATDSGADMIIANGNDIDNIYRIMEGRECGTLFQAHKNKNFDLLDYLAKY